MPRGNGTGPTGRGPRTGRRMGSCNPAEKDGRPGRGKGRGTGRGAGRGGRSR